MTKRDQIAGKLVVLHARINNVSLIMEKVKAALDQCREDVKALVNIVDADDENVIVH